MHEWCTEVLHITCNMCTRDLPDVYTLSRQACSPWVLGIHIRQIPYAHVTTISVSYELSAEYIIVKLSERSIRDSIRKIPKDCGKFHVTLLGRSEHERYSH